MKRRFRPQRFLKQWIVDAFHELYYESPDTWPKNRYFGHQISQLPSDLLLYQELVYAERPRYVLQTGVWNGGLMLYFAHLFDLLGAPPEAIVVGVDIALKPEAKSIQHPRIHLIEGSSVAPETIEKIRALVPAGGGLVSLDSDHSRDHVLAELRLYHEFVAVGGHLVVEDTNVHGHPVFLDHGPGPFEAVDAFLAEDSRFSRDDALWQRQLFSFHQYGWLRRHR